MGGMLSLMPASGVGQREGQTVTGHKAEVRTVLLKTGEKNPRAEARMPKHGPNGGGGGAQTREGPGRDLQTADRPPFCDPRTQPGPASADVTPTPLPHPIFPDPLPSQK